MAQTIFKGFKQVTESYSNFSDGYIYFVRTNGSKTDGYVYFNGKKYGTAEDAENDIKALLGEVPSGTTISDWIDSIATQQGQTEAKLDNEISARTAADDTLRANINAEASARTEADDTLQTNIDAEATARTQADAELQAAINKLNGNDETEGSVANSIKVAINDLDSTVSGQNESGQINVEVVEADGKLTSVTVTAGKFDVDGAAESALTEAEAYTDSAKTTIDAYTVNGYEISKNPVLDGADIKLDGYSKPETSSAIVASDSVNEAIGKLEKAIEDTGGDAITSIEAGDGIAVSEKSNHKQTVSANVDSASTAGVSVVIDSETKKIKANVTTLDTNATITDNADGVVSGKGVRDAINALDVDDTAVANQYVSAVSEADGKISVSRVDLPVIGVKANDKILALDDTNHVIGSTMSFTYNSDNRKIYLYGSAQDDVHKIGEVDCSDFIKDGMLYGEQAFNATDTSQEITIKEQSHTFSGLTVGHQYIAFVFTDGAVEPTYSWDILDMTETVKPYTAGNGIEVSGYTISAKVANANGLSVDSEGIKMGLADGSNNGAMSSAHYIKLEGIETGAQANVLEGVQVNGNDLDIDENKKVNVTVTTGNNDGTISVNGTDVAVKGLGSAAYTDSSDYDEAGAANEAYSGATDYTDAQIAELDATVSGESNDVKVTVTEENGIITNVTVEVELANSGVTEEGHIPDAKKVYDKIVAETEARESDVADLQAQIDTIEGEITGITGNYATKTELSAETEARETADTNLYNAITAETAAREAAINALDATVTGTSNDVEITVTETNGVLTAATAVVKISDADDNALQSTGSGLFAAIYYEDLDNDVQ